MGRTTSLWVGLCFLPACGAGPEAAIDGGAAVDEGGAGGAPLDGTATDGLATCGWRDEEAYGAIVECYDLGLPFPCSNANSEDSFVVEATADGLRFSPLAGGPPQVDIAIAGPIGAAFEAPAAGTTVALALCSDDYWVYASYYASVRSTSGELLLEGGHVPPAGVVPACTAVAGPLFREAGPAGGWCLVDCASEECCFTEARPLFIVVATDDGDVEMREGESREITIEGARFLAYVSIAREIGQWLPISCGADAPVRAAEAILAKLP